MQFYSAARPFRFQGHAKPEPQGVLAWRARKHDLDHHPLLVDGGQFEIVGE